MAREEPVTSACLSGDVDEAVGGVSFREDIAPEPP
jgi:hypothetical protein